MFLDDGSILFDSVPSIRQTIDAVYDMFKERWKTSYDYRKVKPIYFGSKPLKSKYKKDRNFMKSILYVSDIANALLNRTMSKRDYFITREIEETEDSGCACIYATVLLYCLLERDGFIDKDECFLTQGFYRYDLRDDFPDLFMPLIGRLQTGLHAFLNFYGSVIDLSLYPQQKMTFDFKKTTDVMGIIPSGMKLIGFNETSDIVMQYVEQFAEINKVTVKDWIEYHSDSAELFMLEHEIECLESVFKEIGDK